MEGKKNFIYLFMIIAIIVSIYHKYTITENPRVVEEILEQTTKTQEATTIQEHLIQFWNKFLEFKGTRNFKYTIFSTILLLIIGFAWTIYKGKKSFAKEELKKKQLKQSTLFAEPIQDKSKYELITKETTKKEIEKLYENVKFKKMLNEKGETTENWNWQSREKAKRTVFREEKSDTSDEHMSQVDFSDNEN